MILLYFYIKKKKKNTIVKIGQEGLVKELLKNYSTPKFRLKFILLTCTYALLVIALANPRLPNGRSEVKHSGIDVMIALDVSKSMLAGDIAPSRIERAKQIVTKLIDKLSDDRIGIVVFAGRAYLQMPLTTDHAAAKMYLSTATTDIVPTQGTVIGDALKMCNASFNSKEKKYKTVILISDGEDHDESALKITRSMADEGVMVNTIGIGSAEGSVIKDAVTNEIKKDQNGTVVITKLNEGMLKEIAAAGNGIYQLFASTDDVVNKLQNRLQDMGQHLIKENSAVNYVSFFPYILMLALLFIVLEYFISEKISSKKMIAKKIISAITVTVFFTQTVAAQNQHVLIKKGNEAYQKKEYNLARDQYKQAAKLNPQNEKAAFNLGYAYYKSGNPDSAMQAYDAAIENSKLPADKSSSWYNKGVVQQNNKKLPDCIESYKNALRLNPADEDARQNLQKAIQQQKKDQPKKQQKDQPKKEPKEEQKEKEKQQKQQDKDKNDAPQPQQSKMSEKEAAERLKTVEEHEKNLQDKLKKINGASLEKPEKDW